MNWLFGGEGEPQGSVASRLVDRIRTSELVEDRRSAVHALKQLSAEAPQAHAVRGGGGGGGDGGGSAAIREPSC